MNDLEDEKLAKVLFVDDEENILNALRRLTENEDFEAIFANSASEALEMLKSDKNVGLIVSDQRLPDISGVELLTQAKSLAPDALRIVLTGYADINATVDAINLAGAYRYVAKPWKDDDLLHTVREAVATYLLLQDNKMFAAHVMKQNEELMEWNDNLKNRVIGQMRQMRKQIEELRALNEKTGSIAATGSSLSK